MRMKNMITMCLMLTLIALTAAGCMGSGSAADGGSVDDIEGIEEIADGNAFFEPAGESGSDRDDVGPADAEDYTYSDAAADFLEVEFMTDAFELGALQAQAGEDFVSALIEVKGGSGQGFVWTHDLPDGFDVVPYSSNSSRIQIRNTSEITEGMVGSYDFRLTATDAAGEGGSAEISLTLVVASGIHSIAHPGVQDLQIDVCSQPMKVEVTENGEWDPSDFRTDAQVGMTRTVSYKVSGGMAPYTWRWESKVMDSHHCHPFLPPVGYDEGFFVFIPGNAECGDGMIDEWTVNPSWHPKYRRALLDQDAAVTQGDTLSMEGTFIYDGPVPTWGKYEEDESAEALYMTVYDSCPEGSHDVEGVRMPHTAVRLFDIVYPDDAEAFTVVTVKYKELNTYSSNNFLRLELFDGRPDEEDLQDDENYLIGEAELNLDGLPKCKEHECTEKFYVSWQEDLKGPRDVIHAKVIAKLGLKQTVSGTGFKDSSFEYGDMNVTEIRVRSPHWVLVYDDEEAGNLMDNNNSKKDTVFITDAEGVKFKRRAFPSTFINKWNPEEALPPAVSDDQ